MKNLIITVDWLVETLRHKAAKNKYTKLLNIPQDKEVDFVIDLLQSSLQSLFFSMESMPDYDYDVLFSRYTDKEQLYLEGKEEFRFIPDEVDCMVWDPVQMKEVPKTIVTLPSHYDMCTSIFDEFFHDFVEELGQFIAGNARFNGYAEVTLKTVDPRQSFLLVLGGDVRHKVFKGLFKDGRYDEAKYQHILDLLEEETERERTEGSLNTDNYDE